MAAIARKECEEGRKIGGCGSSLKNGSLSSPCSTTSFQIAVSLTMPLLHKIQSIMDKYCVLGIDYLVGGLSSVVKVKETSSIESLFSFSRKELFRASSAAKHSFISAASSLMFGLLTEAGDMQAIAISTAFQAELVSNSPFNLVSTIFLTYVRPLMCSVKSTFIKNPIKVVGHLNKISV
ncbi:hypothetical protein L6164_004319 [Bauhinia variegata]|uniref:Uncharacterized protein n=1 Tax=Bauhinia variegata TaxID=167791 RepID=A0ACB9Q364_BAUVA|nr:hypothetical protein L6164_004319 [Bauhinia variegata]